MRNAGLTVLCVVKQRSWCNSPLNKREGNWDQLTLTKTYGMVSYWPILCPVKSFAKTSGTVTGDRTRPSFLLVSKVTNFTSPSGEALRDVKER